jgi:hypothetical protein
MEMIITMGFVRPTVKICRLCKEEAVGFATCSEGEHSVKVCFCVSHNVEAFRVAKKEVGRLILASNGSTSST